MLLAVSGAHMQHTRTIPAAAMYAVIGLVAFLVYVGTFDNAFVWDDVRFVQENAAIRDPGTIGRLLTHLASQDYFAISREYYYRPIVTISYVVDHAVWGLSPVGFHATNALLHALASVLFAAVAFRLCGISIGIAAGALFAVHPIHTEAVALITGRVDLWPAVFVFGAILCWLEGRRRGHIRPWVPIAACLYGLGCLSKEIAFTCPFLIVGTHLALGETPRESDAIQRALWWHVPLWIVAGLYALVRFGILEPPGEAPSRYGGTLLGTALNTVPVVATYLQLFVWPRQLSVYHNWPDIASAGNPVFLASLFLIVLLTGLAWALRKQAPGFWWGWISFFICLGPVLNIVPIKIPIAERYLYLPSAGLCLAAAALWDRGRKILSPRVGIAIGVIVASALALRTMRRNRDYASEASLYASAVQIADENGDAYYNYGLMYYRNGDLQQAEEQFRKALSVPHPVAQALGPLANILLARNQPDEARALVEEALALQPEEWQLHFIHGQVFAAEQHWPDAIAAYARAYALAPGSAKLRLAYVTALVSNGDREAARRLCDAPLDLADDDAAILGVRDLCASLQRR